MCGLAYCVSDGSELKVYSQMYVLPNIVIILLSNFILVFCQIKFMPVASAIFLQLGK